jgi:RimJ/RimL family protein N-acetyltransferase
MPFAVMSCGGRWVNALPRDPPRASASQDRSTWLEPTTWATGVNNETKRLLLDHAFERCHLQRVEFKTDALNERSRGALLPTTFEGVFRKYTVLPTRMRDFAWYSITEHEWPELRAFLLRRLEVVG